MSTHDYNLANQVGSDARADLNLLFQAIVSQNSSATEPATMFANMFWFDTTAGYLKQRNSTNTAWNIAQSGAYLESIVLGSAPVTLTTSGTTYNITSITLTPGRWLVTGSISFTSGTVDTRHVGNISITSGTLGGTYEHADLSVSFGSGASHRMSCPAIKVDVTTTQIVYLLAFATFSGTSPTAHGKISALRMTAF